ncbi:Uncharacterised protein [Pseudomonas fluorescens]|uniref:Uncharacterized protein n=1 Tax=Pseudomonas fluorescens TaxID=294 RepID=A0A3S4R558_PSEFL|nr:Uncharacterised protein [Pseudomonas fluorescens]
MGRDSLVKGGRGFFVSVGPINDTRSLKRQISHVLQKKEWFLEKLHVFLLPLAVGRRKRKD